MRALLRLAIRELRNHWRFSFFFVLNLASGLVGLILISSLLSSVQKNLDERSQSMLAGDLSVSIRRPLTEAEEKQLRALLPSGSAMTAVADFFSMLEIDGESRLVQVRAIQKGYPLYGGIRLKGHGVANSTVHSSLEEQPFAWVDTELAQEFQLEGKHFHIGGVPFQYGDAVLEDSTQGIMTLAAAPRVVVARKWFSNANLESRGTTLRYSWLIRLAPGSSLEELKQSLEKTFDDPSVRVQTHKESSEGLARLLKYFSDYLALVSLSSLSLAALGVVYQFRRFFLARSKSLAILLSLGATHRRALQMISLELIMLSLAGSGLALIAASLALPVFAKALEPLSIIPLSTHLEVGTALKAIVTGIGLSFLLCLPQLLALGQLNASALFREQSRFAENSGSLWGYAPAFLAFAVLSVLYANSFRLAAYFVLGLAGSALLFTSLPWALLKTISRLAQKRRFEVQFALLHLRRNPTSTLLVCVCLGLVTLLASLLPQLRTSVRAEIETPDQGDRPSFFLLDIQPDQLQPLTVFLQEQGTELQQPSALIRGKLLEQNGEKANRFANSSSFVTREEEQEAAFRNRGFNLSYRQELSSSETLIEGRPFDGKWDSASGKIPQISVEQRFAERLGWKMGDVLTFDIAGEKVKGQVTNIRKVRWASFQPNFFVVFQSGVLENMSGVFIGTVSRVTLEKARQISRAMTKAFPNVSIIKVDQVLERLYTVSEQMISSLLLTTLWVILAAALTLYSIARYESYHRMPDMNLLKVIGASEQTVRRIFLWETLWVTALSSVLGAISGVAISYALMRWGLEGTWRVDPGSLFAAIIVTIAWMHIQTVLSARRVWRARPVEFLGA